MSYSSSRKMGIQKNGRAYQIGDEEEGINLLIAEVLKEGKENPDYFRTSHGRYWAEIGSLDPRILFETSVKGTEREGKPYTPLKHCFCERKSKSS